MQIAHLGRSGGDVDGFAALREEFVARNEGYDLAWLPRAAALASAPTTRIAFVQAGEARAVCGAATSPLCVGDVLVLRPGESIELDAPAALLVFTVPEAPAADVPTFLRPDHDPQITDTPGGCATASDAYRRVVLTWLGDHGPYCFRALNCHRVRMTDSFSHYHPHDGGFDEMYLVQDAPAGARLHVSRHVARIERPDEVRTEDVPGLVETVPLVAGDLVWVGRGDMHRAVGGALAHVITVPGFVPGSEIGVDHHLRAIDERLGLDGETALPYHADASTGPVVK